MGWGRRDVCRVSRPAQNTPGYTPSNVRSPISLDLEQSDQWKLFWGLHESRERPSQSKEFFDSHQYFVTVIENL